MSMEIKSKLLEIRAEAMKRYLDLNSSNLSDYRHQQGIIQGIEYSIGAVDRVMKEEMDA